MKKHSVDIFSYRDYRKFLSDYYDFKKTENPKFSHRLFTKNAGLSSPSHLYMIINGSRNLSLKTIPKFTMGMKLKAKEKKYFELLVLYNQTMDPQLKAKYFLEVLHLKSVQTGIHTLEAQKFYFLAQWHYVAIYVLIETKDFRPDPIWISKRMGLKVSPSQAKETLDVLLKLKLIEVDSTKGYKQIPGALDIADDTQAMAVLHYHHAMMQLAIESLRSTPLSQREMNGVTLHIPIDKLPELKEKIRSFRNEINLLTSSYENSEEVYQFNIQLFPLTKSKVKNEKIKI